MVQETISKNAAQMSPAGSPLKIDEQRTAAAIQNHIRNLVEEHSARGVLIGLSGGLDSALLTALAVRALGKESVNVSYLCERDSERESESKARLVADWLGLELEVRNIEPAMRENHIYAPLIMRIIALSHFVNRYLLNGSYRWLCGESPFVSTLRRDVFDSRKFKRRIYNSSVRHIEAAFNARHICRRQILERQAKDSNWLLLGAANRSEYLVGWFVRGGIDDLPLSPLMGLYKTQIRQLAAYLGVPPEIQEQTPSPDMIKGINDESALGISYTKIDIVLDGTDCGLSDEEIIAAGVAEREITLVRKMNRLSSWKRGSEHANPPVDGGAGGDVRMACPRRSMRSSRSTYSRNPALRRWSRQDFRVLMQLQNHFRDI